MFCFLLSFFSLYLNICDKRYIINLSDYPYPSPKDTNYTYIPIVSTTDLHGYAFSRTIRSRTAFSFGGISLFNSYLQSLRREWGSRLLWFDSGDKFQGALESTITNGTIMTDFFNYAKLDLSVLGNHEFDHGIDFLSEQMNKTASPYITTNIRDKETNNGKVLPNTLLRKVIKVTPKIKIGVIGFTPSFTYYTTGGNVTKLNFIDMNDIVESEAETLRKDYKVNAVVLLIHSGIECNSDSEVLNIYHRNNSSKGECDKSTELYQFLINIKPGIIDAVLGGHVHQPGHHFINNIPIIHSKDRGAHFHIIYLPFKDSTLINDDILVEGPIPICEKISPRTKTCVYTDRNEEMTDYYFHHYRINFDKRIEREVLSKYEKGLKQYREYVCSNEDMILTKGDFENAIGNIQTDVIRNHTKADLVILNNGCFRTSIYPGPIYVEQIYDMNPFKTDVFTYEMTGAEMFRLLKEIQTGPKKYYQTSGIRQYIKNGDLIKIARLNGESIDDNSTYTIGLNDFLLNGGDDVKQIYKWYKVRNVKQHGKLNDMLIKSLKQIETLYEKNFYEKEIDKRRLVFIKDST